MRTKDIIENIEAILDFRLDEIGCSLEVYKEDVAEDEDFADTIIERCLEILEEE